MEFPSVYLNASKTFIAPQRTDSKTEISMPSSFLWQAPNSNAMLFPGERWTELHGFVSRTLEVQRGKAISGLLAGKTISQRFPSWLEHGVRLSRARGYFTFYPSYDTATSVATIHNELYQAPEEYEQTLKKDKKGGHKSTHDGEFPSRQREVTMSGTSLLDTLPSGGNLQPFNDLPLLSWDGEETEIQSLDDMAREYATAFRENVGNCNPKQAKSATKDESAKDLFCTEST
jgi:hypothetical protein